MKQFRFAPFPYARKTILNNGNKETQCPFETRNPLEMEVVFLENMVPKHFPVYAEHK